MELKLFVALLLAVSESVDSNEVLENEVCHSGNGDEGCNKEAIEEVGVIDESLNNLEQDDPKLVQILKEKYLIPPSQEAYNFSKKAHLDLRGQFGQPLLIEHMLNGKKNGFFIEAGAYDGEIISNSLLFEIKHQWTGLLVEPNPEPFEVC